MMYGADTWAVKKAQEKRLDVAEMMMLRWMCGDTKLDRIRNERIRGTTKVGEISKTVHESIHSKNKWCFEGPYRVLHVVPNTGPYLVLQGTPIEGASKDPLAMVL